MGAALFQLHHTGIKTHLTHRAIHSEAQFQLHHTGIKTIMFLIRNSIQYLFQLHHTGIKTFHASLDRTDGI